MRVGLVVCLLLLALPASADDFTALPSRMGYGQHMYPGDSTSVVHVHQDTTLVNYVDKAGNLVVVPQAGSLSSPTLRYFSCTAPTVLDVRGNCDYGGGQARSQLYVVLYAALRKPHWYDPLIVVALDSTGYVEPGTSVTLSTAFADTGATFFVMSRNMAGYSCWSNLVGP